MIQINNLWEEFEMSENSTPNTNRIVENIVNAITPDNIQKYILGTKKSGHPRALYDIIRDKGKKKKKKKKGKNKDNNTYALYLTSKKKKKKKKDKYWKF